MLVKTADGFTCRCFSYLRQPGRVPLATWSMRRVPQMPPVDDRPEVNLELLLIDPLTAHLLGDATLQLEHDDGGHLTAVHAELQPTRTIK